MNQFFRHSTNGLHRSEHPTFTFIGLGRYYFNSQVVLIRNRILKTFNCLTLKYLMHFADKDSRGFTVSPNLTLSDPAFIDVAENC